MTAEELLLMPKIDGRRFELIRGVLIERMPGGKSQGLVNSRIDAALSTYSDSNDYGDTLSADTGYWLDREPDTVRAPDVAWFAPGRLPDEEGFPNLALRPGRRGQVSQQFLARNLRQSLYVAMLRFATGVGG